MPLSACVDPLGRGNYDDVTAELERESAELERLEAVLADKVSGPQRSLWLGGGRGGSCASSAGNPTSCICVSHAHR